MILMTRADWTDHGPAAPLTRLDVADVLGVALHHPGEEPEPMAGLSQQQIAARLEAYRRGHVFGRGWDDIAYNVAFDAAGRVWPLRGLQYRCAANGDRTVNQHYLAFLLLTGDTEAPPQTMVDAVVRYRAEQMLALYPRGLEVVGHRDIRPHPTACPGDLTEAMIRAGDFSRRPVTEPPAFVLKRLLRVASPRLRGADVRALQEALKARGIALGRYGVDGTFGPDTEYAVRLLQRHEGLPVDGVVGRDTALRLGWGWAR